MQDVGELKVQSLFLYCNLHHPLVVVKRRSQIFRILQPYVTVYILLDQRNPLLEPTDRWISKIK